MKTTETNKLIDIKLIDENPQNPRTEIGDVSDLEASIKAHGLIQPITVRPVGKRYQVVAGSRRFTALKNLNFTKISCNVREIDDKEAFEIATTENITRKDMDPADECMAVAKMLDDGNDIHTVASHFGRHPRWVIGRVKMARLGGEALEKLKDGTITLGHAEALTMADDKDIERFLGMAEYRSPEELKNIILNERKNLANAKFDTYKICKNCPKQSVTKATALTANASQRTSQNRSKQSASNSRRTDSRNVPKAKRQALITVGVGSMWKAKKRLTKTVNSRSSGSAQMASRLITRSTKTTLHTSLSGIWTNTRATKKTTKTKLTKMNSASRTRPKTSQTKKKKESSKIACATCCWPQMTISAQ